MQGDVSLRWTWPDPDDRLGEPVELEVRVREVPGVGSRDPGQEIGIRMDGVPITLTPDQARFVANALAIFGIQSAWERRK